VFYKVKATSKLGHAFFSNKHFFRQLSAPARVLTSPPDSSHLRSASKQWHDGPNCTDLLLAAKKWSS